MEYKNTGYFISKNGIVTNKKGKVLKQYRNDLFVYYCVVLRINKKPKTFYVHRMLAETYLENPENKEFINHINGIKTDNRVENIEWVTRSENVKHCYDTGLKKYKPLHYKGKFGKEHNRSKAIIDVRTNKTYGSISEASRDLSMPVSTVHYNIGKHFQFIKI
jgi:hypothetical protein